MMYIYYLLLSVCVFNCTQVIHASTEKLSKAYETLGVTIMTSKQNIKKNFYKKILESHPDKNVNATLKELELFKQKTQEYIEAYSIINERPEGTVRQEVFEAINQEINKKLRLYESKLNPAFLDRNSTPLESVYHAQMRLHNLNLQLAKLKIINYEAQALRKGLLKKIV